jgi:integrase
MTAYSLGRCRCDYCRGAYATYRAHRRADGKDNPTRPRPLDTDGHIPNDWFRSNIWLPALKAARLEIKVRLHDLRHAHASWLLARGADLQVVSQRLGQSSLRTTERYQHTLPDADETALDALAKDQEPCRSGLTAARRQQHSLIVERPRGASRPARGVPQCSP